jgi:hypothetical protein
MQGSGGSWLHGFIFTSISNDLNHLGAAARDHLARARDRST